MTALGLADQKRTRHCEAPTKEKAEGGFGFPQAFWDMRNHLPKWWEIKAFRKCIRSSTTCLLHICSHKAEQHI